MKLCKDCQHHTPSKFTSGDTNYDKCAILQEEDTVLSPVDGLHRVKNGIYTYCEAERATNGRCGPEAVYFVEKITLLGPPLTDGGPGDLRESHNA